MNNKKLLLCVVGASGSIGTTIAIGNEILKISPQLVLNYLITKRNNSFLKEIYNHFEFSGWDLNENTFENSYSKNKPVKYETYNLVKDALKKKKIFLAADFNHTVEKQADKIQKDIKKLKKIYKNYDLVMVNTLPASEIDFNKSNRLELKEIMQLKGRKYQDLGYLIASIREGVPFVNFTPNPIELDAIVKLAEKKNSTICGRDGKTGQTYFKVVLASSLRARNLQVKGWYSTNILGNDDGKNLSNKDVAINKINQKNMVLDKALGYKVDDHVVHIDYYPPRKDNKEANDVIDFNGFLDEEMSMRVNILCKDSILAAPMIFDISIISAYLKYYKGKKGLLSETAFFYKLPVGSENINATYESQVNLINDLLHGKGEYARK